MRFIGMALVAVLALGGCDGGGGVDAGPGAAIDAGLDGGAGSRDAAADAMVLEDAGAEPDAAASDAGPAPDPIGSITGMCGVLDDELTSATPHHVDQVATYPDGWTVEMADALSTGAQEILADGTAGGSSGYSEAFAFEILHRCEGATFVKSETEIVYTTSGSITDILVEIGGERIGVSVTRAVTVTGMCTRDGTYSDTQATDLLTDKLRGVNESSMNVAPEDAWTKQILFIHADTTAAATALMDAWSTLDPSLRADTIVYVSVSEAMDGFLYFEDRCL